MDSSVVIKVKYGETLRRFNAPVNVSEQLDIDMAGLRAKILDLFKFAPDADITLTYVDEDGDVVTLVDDDDLHDVMRQCLNPLRINVILNSEKGGSRSFTRSSGSSTPLRSPRVQNPLPNINYVVSELVKSVPEPFRESLSKLSLELLSKSSASSPLAELVDNLVKMGQSSRNQSSENPSNVVSEVPKGPSHAKDVVTLINGDALVKQLRTAIPMGQTSKGSQGEIKDGTDGKKPDHCGASSSSSDLLKNCNQKPYKVPEVGTGKCEQKNPSDVGNSGSQPGWNHLNTCPFTGMPLGNDAAGYHRFPLHKRGGAYFDGPGTTFHKGVRCDGCGVFPITGPRFKSKVKEDYDLCSICFSKMGSEADYIRLDHPVSYRHPWSIKGLYDYRPPARLPVPPHGVRGCTMKMNRPKLDSRFILDVNIVDGTMVAPSTPFTKIWRMHNNGSIVWPKGTQLVWIGGDKLTDAISVEVEIPDNGVAVGNELDIAVDFKAPELPGRYISYWRMGSPSGVKFGQRVWVLIQVDASTKDSFGGNYYQGLNLNLPPDNNNNNNNNNGGRIHENIDMNVEPLDDYNPPEVGPGDLVQPVIEEQQNKEQDLNFPINDALLVGNGISNPLPAPEGASSSGVSYPIIDLSEVVLPNASAPLEEERENNGIEQQLLKELDEMGFKQMALNKEILRMNEYNLEQSVDALCGVSEWDPILDELEEMGFCDKEKNKELLKKNNGSIKRVVMDLIAKEKDA